MCKSAPAAKAVGVLFCNILCIINIGQSKIIRKFVNTTKKMIVNQMQIVYNSHVNIMINGRETVILKPQSWKSFYIS